MRFWHTHYTTHIPWNFQANSQDSKFSRRESHPLTWLGAFAGVDAGLCKAGMTNPNWTTDSRGLGHARDVLGCLDQKQLCTSV